MADPFQEITPLFGDPIGRPHKWFAWRPIRTFDGRLVWLACVWRQRVQLKLYLQGGSDFWWRYAVTHPTDGSDEA